MGKPAVVEYIVSAKGTGQESISAGPLYLNSLSVENTKPTLLATFDAVIRCNEPGQGLSSDFLVAIRVDGQVIGGTRVLAFPGESNMQRVHVQGVAEGLAKGTHQVEAFVNAGASTVIVYGSVETPSLLGVSQA